MPTLQKNSTAMQKLSGLSTANLSSLNRDDLFMILDNIDDALFIDNAKGYTLWLNKACEILFNVRKEDLLGVHISKLEHDGIFTPSVARLVMEKLEQIDIVHHNKDGKRILSTGTPIFDEENNLTTIITTSRDITELVNLQNELESVQNTLQELQGQEKFYYGDVVANSHSMFGVIQLAKRLAEIDSTVLITGESGVGKGVVAKLIHENGKRKDFPFIKVNCGAIPENLIESELFGYESGAFTGSRIQGKTGLFEAAENGSIFLDEISELPLNLQVKLLQVIQEREIKRVGGIKNIPVNTRIISATNKDLFALVREGKFREDLYYRLNVVPMNIPPLRERHEDLIPLINQFINKNNMAMNVHKEIDPDALAILLRYNWPGNVRELQNIIERIMITTRGNKMTPENLPVFIREYVKEQQTFPADTSATLKETLERTEQRVLLDAYEQYKSTRKIAKMLGISQPTVVRKLKKYGISGPID